MWLEHLDKSQDILNRKNLESFKYVSKDDSDKISYI